VTTNKDARNLLARDLWVDSDKWEIWTKVRGVELADDDASAESEDTEESIYENGESEYKEDEYELVSEDGTEDSESEYEEDEYELVSEDGTKDGESE
jgi:hypothetical protein